MAIDYSGIFFGRNVLLRGRNAAVPVTEINVNNIGQNVRWASVFDTGYALAVSSSSVADTDAGTGARTISIYGLDNDFNPLQEIVTLNGQTKVVTTGLFRRVFELIVQSTGTGLANAGDIYVIKNGTDGGYAAGVPAVLTSGCIKAIAGDNFGLSGLYTVPYGKIMAMTTLGFSARAQSGTIKIIHGFPLNNNLIYPSMKVDFAPSNPYVLQGTRDDPILPPFGPCEDIYFNAFCAVAGGLISCYAKMVQINN